MSTIQVLLQRQSDEVWSPKPPASEVELMEAERALGTRLEPAYRGLLAYSSGGALYGERSDVIFFPARALAQFRSDAERPELADMIIFGDDQGDFFFYFDPLDQLGRGAWAVYGVEKSAARKEWSRYVARDLQELVERALAGASLLSGQPIGTSP